jgi:hypothetical protein
MSRGHFQDVEARLYHHLVIVSSFSECPYHGALTLRMKTFAENCSVVWWISPTTISSISCFWIIFKISLEAWRLHVMSLRWGRLGDLLKGDL